MSVSTENDSVVLKVIEGTGFGWMGARYVRLWFLRFRAVVRRFFEAWEGSETGSLYFCRGGFWPPRLGDELFRRPHPVIPRQVAPQQSLLLFHWTNWVAAMAVGSVSRFRFPGGL